MIPGYQTQDTDLYDNLAYMLHYDKPLLNNPKTVHKIFYLSNF